MKLKEKTIFIYFILSYSILTCIQLWIYDGKTHLIVQQKLNSILNYRLYCVCIDLHRIYKRFQLDKEKKSEKNLLHSFWMSLQQSDSTYWYVDYTFLQMTIPCNRLFHRLRKYS